MRENGTPMAVTALSATQGSGDAEHEPWTRLSDFSSRKEADPELQISINDALTAYQALRGVTFAIATRYRNLIDAIPDPMTILDEHGKILDANSAACTVYGYEHADLTRLGLLDLTPSLAADHVHAVLESSRLGRTVVTETLAKCADGTRISLEVHSRLFTDDGETRIITLSRDLRAKKGAVEHRNASDARLRLLMQMLDKGVIMQDASGRILSCNPAACRIFGHSEHEMLSTESRSFQRWQFVDEAGNALDIANLPSARALRSGSPVATTICGIFFPKQQVLRWLSVAAVPEFREGETQPFQVVSTFDDVSVIKREAELYSQTQVLANIGGWQLDFSSDALIWTSHMYTIFDLPTTTSMTVDRMSRFFQPDDRKQFRKMLLDARMGTLSELELRVTSSIGRRRWVRLVARPLHHDNFIYGLIGTLQDVTERRRVEDNLQRKVTTDNLTGLPNRDAILDSITRSITAARIGEGPCLLLLNLDRFRSVNHQLGYGIGDLLLKASAERLLKRLPPEAELARFAGDEFMVLMPPGSRIAQGEQLAAVLANEFELPFKAGDHEFRLSISIGIACHPDDGIAAQQLIAHAGAALAEAKRGGRNTWQRFSPDLARRASNRMRIEQHLHNAIASNELRLEFQPQINLRDGKVLGAEALLRWNNSELGELRPDIFVPLAEASGSIVAIGEWAIREACRQMRDWRDEGVLIARIAVNISYGQILSGTLVNTVISALRDFGLPGEALELELTERVLVEDRGENQQTFAMLQGLGVKLVIDDFGEGYSALGYLRRLPVDGLKISHSFMQNVPSDPTDTAICEAIISIARSLGLLVIAEGVETQAQCEFLLEQNTLLAQGHLFSRALKPDAFATFVRTRSASPGAQATLAN